MLAVFARGKLDQRGAAIQEGKSGIGYVDVLITFSSGLLHVLELKILKGNDLPGPVQLDTYMKQKNRPEGWLILFDVRPAPKKRDVAPILKRTAGTIRTVVVDLNPVPPSKLKAS
jgi:hypothetical protein